MACRLENDCVDCGMHCLGSACPNRSVPHYYCDCCGEEAELYHYHDLELCETCLLNEFPKVEGSEY